ncbi:MAG: dTDP-glucose 4,6-dehydratase [Planctomycetota bacterium]
MKVLISGVLGFIGSHLWKIMSESGYNVLPTARHGGPRSAMRVSDRRRKDIYWADLTSRSQITGMCEGVDAVIHCAAKTFVDHSIRDPEPFIRNNVDSTVNLLEEARVSGVKRFIMVSTDEVYGPIMKGQHTEESPLAPSNPYSASKAAAEMFALSYATTYGMEVIVTRTENNYGRWQDRKVIPVFVQRALQDKPLPVYGDGKHRRQWLRVEDHCEGLIHVLEHGEAGQVYNIAGEQELENLELAKMVLRLLDKPEDQIQFVPDHDIRPGHDRRYAICSKKLRDHSLGWKPSWNLEDGFADAVEWYSSHAEWLR